MGSTDVMKCRLDRDVTYGQPPRQVTLLLVDRGGLVRVKRALDGTTPRRTVNREGAFETRFERAGVTTAVFRVATDGHGCIGSMASFRYRVGDQWEQLAVYFGEAC